jgi:crotonobetainyl-CoA:carnitine CoA-transferase CaiB-like acyl-CoA transferase
VPLLAEEVPAVPEAGRSPQVRARGIVAQDRDGRHVVFPVLQDGTAMGRVHSPAPALGAHTEQVLADLVDGKEPW